MKLSLSALDALPGGVARPTYARSEISPGIVHVGTGNFHRAHQAVYLDDLFNAGLSRDWGLVGAGVRPNDAKMRDILGAQDWLTTVVELEPGNNRARVTGAMIDFVEVERENRALIARMAAPEIRIVSLTVTEGGYCINPATQAFDPEHPEIAHDAQNPDTPVSVFGAIVAALKVRRAAGLPPFTVMSCDNIPGNGHVAKNAVAGLAALSDPGFAEWILGNVAFPDGMVDRITPATSAREREALKANFGIEDGWPVFCEPFRQWVLEDHFPEGRPAFEEVGVTFTSDVSAFELMKIRILNGGHAIIAYPAALLDIHFVHEAMEHPLVRGFLLKLERDEIIPIVPPVPGQDLGDYLTLIETRFANPDVGDTIPRLCQDGSNRQPKFILPSTRDRLAQGAPVTGLALESALWARYCYGESESGKPITLDDPNAERLTRHGRAAKDDPLAFLAMTEIFGDVGTNEGFRAAFAAALTSLWARGVTATLEDYIAGKPL
ncbi:mannitol dehydrogenase family protein [Paroceanicella profunda]|uniref:Mannitol dehydrogenase family protein n=1 Tax=Paroceanicella profunda TaxID=2579971 RepID=A0A5B8FTN4_9RHOB|nr:mannitol dehydrogenase family protein [Paroceanicella profunda]QDL91735.1 mannitol dehydrogenase family protein [Paroceanicella profunda]